MPELSLFPPALWPMLCVLFAGLSLLLGFRLIRLHRLCARQSVELRAARRQEALGTLAGGIAHDFNNILGAILGFGVLLEEDLLSAPEQHDMARNITTAARRGQDIVAQLMRYSRRGAQDGFAGAIPVSLDSLIRESITLLEPCIRRSVRMDYRNETAGDGDVITADATQVGQALVNLCLNADHAIGVRSGRIRISLAPIRVSVPLGDENAVTISGGEKAGSTVTLLNGRLRCGDYLRLRVEDDGEGMTRETAMRIFEPFFTTRDVGAGTGLGLSALQGVMHDLGGAIVVTTTRFKGTAFELMFPLGGSAANTGENTHAAAP